MAGTLRSLQYFEITGLTGTQTKTFGDRSAFKTVTVGDESFETTKLVQDNFQEETLWATGQGGLTTFDYALLETDQDILVELRDGAVFARFSLAAGARAVFGGTLFVTLAGDGVTATGVGDVDQIIVKRNVADGVGDATVTMRLVE